MKKKLLFISLLIYSNITFAEKTPLINETPNAEISNILSKESAAIEEKRILERRGSIGLGFQLGPDVSGISLRHWTFEKVGFQLIGMTGLGNNASNIISARAIHILKNKLQKKDIINTLYGGIGIGTATIKNDYSRTLTHFETVTDKSILEVFLGVDYPTDIGFHYFFEAAYNMVTHEETNRITNKLTFSKDYWGIKMNIGGHFYF